MCSTCSDAFWRRPCDDHQILFLKHRGRSARCIAIDKRQARGALYDGAVFVDDVDAMK